MDRQGVASEGIVVELGLKHTYGKGCVQCCNMGVGGDTSSLMLKRFERDVTPFRPHLTVVTCGGNDAVPEYGIDEESFAANLQELQRRWPKSCRTISPDS